jgi:hypothetical protein
MNTKFKLILIALFGVNIFALSSLISWYNEQEILPVIDQIEESHSSFSWTPGWESLKDANASGGTLKVSGKPGSKVSVSFIGTGVILHYATGQQSGMATIELDGKTYTYIDMYSPIELKRATKTIASGLENTWHTITITVSGNKNPASSNYYVVVDALGITQT